MSRPTAGHGAGADPRGVPLGSAFLFWGERRHADIEKQAEQLFFSANRWQGVVYGETERLFSEGSISAETYRDRCKTEALGLFCRWFWDLWV